MSKQKPKNTASQHCSYCGEEYRKQDFSVCPFCGGDGGARTPKVWRPNKHQKKEFIKKMKKNDS